MSAYIYRIDEGLQFFALQSGIAERCIKAIQDYAILVSEVVAANTAIFSGTTSHTPSSNT